MGLTSTGILVAVGAMAILLPALLLWWSSREAHRRWWAKVLHWFGILLCQGLAVAMVFLLVNRTFGLYSSWDDLMGVRTGTASTYAHDVKSDRVPVRKVKISPDNPHPRGQMMTLNIAGERGRFAGAEVYLPAAYFEKSQATRRFPVLVMVGAQRDTAEAAVTRYSPMATNSAVIDAGAATPYIAVYVGGQMAEGIDSECLDVPGADQETFLSRHLPDLVRRQFRASHLAAEWFISGWSTGGWCSALMVARHPETYRAAGALAPYFHPIFEDPAPVSNPLAVADAASLVARVQKHEFKHLRLLSVMSRTDLQSWGPADQGEHDGQRPPDGRVFFDAAKDLPGTSFMLLQGGGHNDGTYMPLLPHVLRWLGARGL